MNTLTKEQITFQDYLDISAKLEVMIGLIVGAERVPKSTKLLKLDVTFDRQGTLKTVLTNLGENLEPEYFIGLKVPFITNLPPTKIMGYPSEAMILVGTSLDGTLEFENFSLGTKLI